MVHFSSGEGSPHGRLYAAKREIEALIQRDKLSAYVKEDRPTPSRKNYLEWKDPDTSMLQLKKGKFVEGTHEPHMSRHTMNTIARGFAGGGETISARKCYERLVMSVSQIDTSEAEVVHQMQ